MFIDNRNTWVLKQVHFKKDSYNYMIQLKLRIRNHIEHLKVDKSYNKDNNYDSCIIKILL